MSKLLRLRRLSQKGFTLIELMIAIVITGIIGLIVAAIIVGIIFMIRHM